MSVLTNFMLVTEDSEEAILISAKELEWVTYIQYPIIFLGNITHDSSILDLILAFLDLGSKVNAMHPAFVEKLGLVVQTTNVGVQKIDGTTLETYGMVVAAFSVIDQADKIKFFEEIFLVINVSPNMVLEMYFFILSGADVNFLKRELWWRLYTIEEAFPTTKRVELVRKKEFADATLDPGHEIFMVYVASLESPSNIQKNWCPSFSQSTNSCLSGKWSSHFYFHQIFWLCKCFFSGTGFRNSWTQ